jgi:hypothetical protein
MRLTMGWLLVVGLLASPVWGAQSVKVEKGKTAVEYKYFDPRHLPDPPPPLEKGEAAVTVYSYGVETNLRYSYPQKPGRGPVKVNFKIESITVTLTLKVTIWLPEDPPAQLKAHEEGHLAISEAFYEKAEPTARGLAEKEVGRVVVGEGSDIDAAGQAVIQKVSTRLCDAYLNAMNGPCSKAQDAFDRITDHGRSPRPSAKEAVEQSLKESPTTRRKEKP